MLGRQLSKTEDLNLDLQSLKKGQGWQCTQTQSCGVRDRRIVRAYCLASLTKFIRELSSVRNCVKKRRGKKIFEEDSWHQPLAYAHTHTHTHSVVTLLYISTAESGAGGSQIPGQTETHTESCLTKQKSKDYRIQPLPICLLLKTVFKFL